MDWKKKLIIQETEAKKKIWILEKSDESESLNQGQPASSRGRLARAIPGSDLKRQIIFVWGQKIMECKLREKKKNISRKYKFGQREYFDFQVCVKSNNILEIIEIPRNKANKWQMTKTDNKWQFWMPELSEYLKWGSKEEEGLTQVQRPAVCWYR